MCSNLLAHLVSLVIFKNKFNFLKKKNFIFKEYEVPQLLVGFYENYFFVKTFVTLVFAHLFDHKKSLLFV